MDVRKGAVFMVTVPVDMRVFVCKSLETMQETLGVTTDVTTLFDFLISIRIFKIG